MLRALLAFSVVGVLAVLPVSADWPEFRGPTGQGHAGVKELPVEWGAKKNIVWRQELPGHGWSSPVVVAEKVYLTAAVALPGSEDLSLRALCLDARTGKMLWDTEVFRQDAASAPRIHAKNSHASPTPILANGRMYVHFGHQGTACLDLTGKVLWSNRTLKYAPVHGNGGSPVLVDDLLIFSADGGDTRQVIALDAATGKAKWKTERSGRSAKGFSFSTPLVITVKGKKQVISPASDMVGAYDPTTGKEIWRVRYRGYSVIPRPVFGHGLVYICTGYNTPSLLAIRPDGSGDVTATHVAWTVQRGVPHTPSLLLVDGELYLVSDTGLASCLDARTGQVHWSRRLGGNGYSASPLYAAGKIYFLSEDGIATVIAPGKTFMQTARNALGERTLASFAPLEGALLLRTEKHLLRIGK